MRALRHREMRGRELRRGSGFLKSEATFIYDHRRHEPHHEGRQQPLKSQGGGVGGVGGWLAPLAGRGWGAGLGKGRRVQ